MNGFQDEATVELRLYIYLKIIAIGGGFHEYKCERINADSFEDATLYVIHFKI